MLDVKKLSPAPWTYSNDGSHGQFFVGQTEDDVLCSDVDCDFVILARDAFEIMRRHGWSAQIDQYPCGWRWHAVDRLGNDIMHEDNSTDIWADPFTAIAEAKKWHMQHQGQSKE